MNYKSETPVPKILVIEDDLTFSRILETFLSRKGYEVLCRHDLKSGISTLKSSPFDLVLLDFQLPDGRATDLLALLDVEFSRLPVIVITSFNDVRTAVQTVKLGAVDYITKPVNPDELLMIIQKNLAPQPVAEENKAPEEFSIIKGESLASEKLYSHIELVAPTDMSVMIIGESGTGKEHIARLIHNLSKRADQPFIAIDCGVLSKELAGSELFGHVKGAFTGALTNKVGLLESADGGTVFLDEIGNLSYDVQVKLLRMLQERTIQPIGSNKTIQLDVRLITATNENLLQEIQNGNFREDIYHRINEFKIQMPPLRERGEDLLLFIDHFIKTSNRELGKKVKKVSPEVMEIFLNYDWPGNLRELKNVVRRMVLLSPTEVIQKDVLPEDMQKNDFSKSTSGSDLKSMQENHEREMILNTLEKVRYNKSKAARLLNIDRKTLYYKMERYGISK